MTISETTFYLYRAGSSIRLEEKPLGGGGEGTVYRLAGASMNGPRWAVKLLKKPDPDKLRAMLDFRGIHDPAAAVGGTGIAYPVDLVVSGGSREICGYVMPLISNARSLFELLVPTLRRERFATFDYHDCVTVAWNIAAVVASVHEAGVVIGDLAPSNLLIDETRGLVSLCDTESWQFFDRVAQRQFLCTVARPEYLAPELVGADLSRTVRSKSHDCFALATLIFQLCFNAWLPYSGTGSDTDQERARKGLFPYDPRTRLRNPPPPGAPPFAHLSKGMQDGFRAVFASGGRSAPNPGARPSAADWLKRLEEHANALVRCPRDPAHFYATVNGHGICPWCGSSGQKRPASKGVFARLLQRVAM